MSAQENRTLFSTGATLLLATLVSVSVSAESLGAADKQRYEDAALSCLDNLLTYGRDHYGPVETPMLASVIDTRTGLAPHEPEVLDSLIHTEGRLHRRNPGGADLWEDQHLLRALRAASRLSGEKKYSEAADDYTRAYLNLSVKENGLLAWGTHIFYDLYTDRPAGDQDGKGPHEILILCPDWESMWKIDPKGVRRQIELMWEWHVVDKETGLHNRHDDKRVGCDFAFFGGELIYAFAFLANVTEEKKYADWASTVAKHHWNTRNPDTNLAPDASSTGSRYDAHHCFTTLPGPHSALLLKAFEESGVEDYRDMALSHIEAYTKYGWDEAAGRFRAMLSLDGTPVMDQDRGEGYDRWKPTGYVDTWRSIMFSYEFPLIAAQTAAYAYEVTDSPVALDAAKKWARHIRRELPVRLGRRWRDDLVEVMPVLEENPGSYAENYGRAISFFLSLHYATKDEGYLRDAVSIANAALDALTLQDGWITGLPSKPLYETVDGVPILLHALLELSAYPVRLEENL